MTEKNWVTLANVPGRLQAELLRGLLEAQGIEAFLSQEGAGAAYGLTIGILGSVEVLVPAGDYENALRVLDEFYAALEQGDAAGESSAENLDEFEETQD